MGIDVKDKAKNGDEAKTGKYTGGKGGDYHDRLQRADPRCRRTGQDRHGDLPVQEQGHQCCLHHQ